MVAKVLIALFALACAVGAVAWFILAWSLIRVPFNAKPGVSVWGLRGNPLNVMLKPELLSTEGLALRQRALKALFFLLVSCLVGLVACVLAYAVVP